MSAVRNTEGCEMKAFRAWLISAAVAGAFAAGDAAAQHHSGSGAVSGTHSWSGTRSWSGTHRAGTWGGRYNGGYPRWHGNVGFYFGVPLFWPGYYGYPYYYDYPRTVVYRDVAPYPMAYPEGEMSAPAAVAPNAPGAPSQGPLYMNYCESAKAYFPKITACPEGWRFIAPAN